MQWNKRFVTTVASMLGGVLLVTALQADQRSIRS